MSALSKTRLTAQEYLAAERKSPHKNEYWAGEICAMAGASERHNLITANLVITLGLQLRGRTCRVYPSDMRVKIPATGLYTYPDVSVVCGRPQFEDAEQDTLINPTLVIEVLSKSSENYDRGKKFQNYRTLPSLTEYILVAQETRQIEHYVRQANDQWLLTETQDQHAVLTLAAVQCTLAVADVYDKVEFPDPTADATESHNGAGYDQAHQ